MPYTLVAEKMQCKESRSGYIERNGRTAKIEECASFCDENRVNGGAGIMFTFGRADGVGCYSEEGPSGLQPDRCRCDCVQEDEEGVCELSYTKGYNLYRSNGKGKK